MAKSAGFIVAVGLLLLLVPTLSMAASVDVWEWQVPQVTSKDLNDVFALSQQAVWVVGNEGAIFHRDELGDWEEILFDAGFITQADWDFHGVFFLDENLGWIVGERNRNSEPGVTDVHQGILLKYEYATWTASYPSLPGGDPGCPQVPFYRVHFATALRGYITAGNGYVLTTTNGGMVWTWTKMIEAGHEDEWRGNCWLGFWAPVNDYYDARTVSDNHGIVAKTTDGGTEWSTERPSAFETVYEDIPDYGDLEGEYANWDIHGVYTDGGYVALSEGYVGKLAGPAWQKLDLDQAPGPIWIKGVWADQQSGAMNNVYAVGSFGAIFHSSDGGQNWSLEHKFSQDVTGSRELKAVHFADSYAQDNHYGWAVGEYGVMVRCTTRAVAPVSGVGFSQADVCLWRISWNIPAGTPDGLIKHFEIHRQFNNPDEGGPDDPLFPWTEPYEKGTWTYHYEYAPLTGEWKKYYFWITVCYEEDNFKQTFGPYDDVERCWGAGPTEVPDPIEGFQVQSEKVPDLMYGLKLAWTPDEAASKYYIYRKARCENAYKYLTTVDGEDDPEYVDWDLLTGQTYDYRIRVTHAFPYETVPSTLAAEASGTPVDDDAPVEGCPSPEPNRSWYDADNHVLHFEWSTLGEDRTFGGFWVSIEPRSGGAPGTTIQNTSPIGRKFYTAEKYFPGFEEICIAALSMDRSKNYSDWVLWYAPIGKGMASSYDGSGYNNGRRSCFDGLYLHEAYWSEHDAGTDTVFYKNSEDWSVKESVGPGKNPSMALRDDGTPCLVWRRDVGSAPSPVVGYLYFAGRSEQGWGTPRALYTTTAEEFAVGPPSFAVTNQNMGYVAWEARERSGLSLKDKVLVGEFSTALSSPEFISLKAIDSVIVQGTSTPLDACPSVAVDLTGQPHLVWKRRTNDEIYYSYRNAGQWSSPQNISESQNNESRKPCISLQGDWLRAVWEEEGSPGAYKTCLWDSWKSRTLSYYSRSEIATGCLEPVIDGNVITMTKEVDDDYEIYASAFDYEDYTWCTAENISNYEPAPSRYSQVVFPTRTESEDAYYYATWTEGGAGHFWLRVADDTLYDLSDQPYYAFNLGQPASSPVTVQREGFLRYGESPETYQEVDYHTQTLVYAMNLEPEGFDYKLGMSYYFEGTGNRYQILTVDGTPLDTASITPGQEEYKEMWIPEQAVLDGSITVQVRALYGDTTVCGELRLCQYKQGGGGGGQSYGGHRIRQPEALRLASISPNPFSRETEIRFDVPHPQKVSVRVYTAAGRQVSCVLNGNVSAGSHVVAWKGLDDLGNPQPGGVYFIRFTAEAGAQTKKAILIR